jgi:competence protein ComEA
MVRKLFCSAALLIMASGSPAMAVTQTPAQTPAQTQSQPPKPQAAPVRGRSSVVKPGRATAASPVNLNTATATDLQTLPGIGKATAARILEYRQKNGGFRKIEDLMNVKGIGEKSFLKLKALVTLTAKAIAP